MSDGIVGIKFDIILSGQMVARIFNSQEQTVTKKEIVARGSSYWQLTKLQTRVYLLKLTNVTS